MSRRRPLLMPSDRFMETLVLVPDRTSTRVILSALILVSVFPLPAVERLWWLFFAVFVAEIGLRLLVAAWSRALPLPEAGMLALDLLATLSFLPIEWHILIGPQARLLRLVRLFALLGYWYPFLSEMVSLTWRPERRRQLLFVLAAVVALCSLGAALISHLAVGVDLNGDGSVGPAEARPAFLDALWWSFRQIESADNIVREPRGGLAFLMSVILTLSGFFVFSFFIGIGSTLVAELVDASRLTRVGLRQHVVVLNPSPDCRILLEEIFSYYKKQLRVPKVAVLGSGKDVPEFLRRAGIRRSRYRTGSAAESAHLSRVDVETARRVLVLKNPQEHVTDAQVVSTVLSVRELNPQCVVYAEVRRAENAAAVRFAGGAYTQPVITREFQGLFLSNLVIFPGMRPLLEELVSSRGQEIYSCIYGEMMMAAYEEPERAALPDFASLARAAYVGYGVNLLGSFGAPGGDTGSAGRLHLRELPPEPRVRGLLGLAQQFGPVRDFSIAAARGRLAAAAASPESAPPMPRFALDAHDSPHQRVLLCGFREQTMVLLEQLARFSGRLDVTILVPTEEEIEEARATLCQPAPRGLARRRVTFTEEAPLCFRASLPHASDGHGVLRLAQGDWSLQADLHAHALQHDTVVVTSDPDAPDPDARTATGILKLVTMLVAEPDRVPPGFRVVGEVQDALKAEVLEERFRVLPPSLRASGVTIDLVSTSRLRNEFLAQSIMVPGIADVLGELLSQGGEQLARLVPGPEGPNALTFAMLTDHFARAGLGIPIAVALAPEGPESPPRTIVNPAPGQAGYAFALPELRAVYAIGPYLDVGTERLPRPQPVDIAT